MNKVSLDILDYQGVLEVLAGMAHSVPAHEAALSLRPLETPEEILMSWAKIAQGRAILAQNEPPDFHDLVDITPLLEQLGPEGALLDPLDLMMVGYVASASRRAGEYFQPQGDIAPLLQQIAQNLDPFEPLVEDLAKTIGPEGEILDTASPLLRKLRHDQIAARAGLTQKLNSLMRSEEFRPIVRDEIVTTRGDRYVIPVRAGGTGRSRGLVHDWSKTGATAYLEPLEAVEGNNELAYLKNREKEEIHRILTDLSDRCRQQKDPLSEAVRILTQLDLIVSQARLADSWRAVTPQYRPGEGYDLRQLRHPLLEKRLLDSGRELIPLDLTVTPQERLLIISGLNTGGKTVALKTFGLCLALAKTGLPIPADEGSFLDFPEDILAVMGDSQDLSADLSTFSGHVRSINEVLTAARPGAVILLDEIGSGTDPSEGAALGLAVLEKLRLTGAFCLAATHFHLIKSWAALTAGVVSVAVKSSQDGRPIYGLSYGSPGFSGGLAMARRLGLPKDLVDRAESYLSDGQKQALALLQRLDDERGALNEEKTNLARQRLSLAETESQARLKLQKELSALQNKSLEQTRDIKAALARHRREMAELKEEIREKLKNASLPDPVALNLKAAEMAQNLWDARPEVSPETQESPVLPLEKVYAGERVLVKKLGLKGLVKSYNAEKDECLIEAGGLSVKAPLKDLYPAEEKAVSGTKVTVSVTLDDRNGLALNLLGQTVDEATGVIDREIDRALVRGQNRLTIIHGLGTGRLRRGIAAHLKTHPKVREFFQPADEPGGQGMTRVELE